ncbi:MAG: hypothetical protein BWK76_28310 [Desulfobulbaceae bacterium A2]|nr:MAG: hypothetical protein BWK76_28310 [Desulfobulbaceae bacterium A2]
MSSQWDDMSAQLNQMSRAKAAEWESYRRQLLNGGRDDLVAAVEQLADVGVREGSYAEGTSAGTRARDIGKELDRVGGFRMMQETHKLVVLALFARTDYEQAASLSRRLECAWDGIGSWQS